MKNIKHFSVFTKAKNQVSTLLFNFIGVFIFRSFYDRKHPCVFSKKRTKHPYVFIGIYVSILFYFVCYYRVNRIILSKGNWL